VTPKVRIKLEQIARLRVVGAISDGRIAELLGLSRPGLSRILALPEYKDAEECILTGTLTKMDEAMAGKVEEIRNALRPGVPAAVRALLDAVTQRRDTRASIVAAKEIIALDPDKALVVRRPEEDGYVPADMSPLVLDNALQDGNQVANTIGAVAKAKTSTKVVQ
jgi:hypothetical protein